jgi:hypothetical protein
MPDIANGKHIKDKIYEDNAKADDSYDGGI